MGQQNSNPVRKSGTRSRKRDRFRGDRNVIFHSLLRSFQALFVWKLHATRSYAPFPARALLAGMYTTLNPCVLFTFHIRLHSTRAIRTADRLIHVGHHGPDTIPGKFHAAWMPGWSKKERAGGERRRNTCAGVRVNVRGGAWRDIMQIKYSWLSGLAIGHAFIFRDE